MSSVFSHNPDHRMDSVRHLSKEALEYYRNTFSLYLKQYLFPLKIKICASSAGRVYQESFCCACEDCGSLF